VSHVQQNPSRRRGNETEMAMEYGIRKYTLQWLFCSEGCRFR